MPNKTLMRQNILEIIASERSVHTLHVLDEVKKLCLITKTEFDKDAVVEGLLELQKEGLVVHLEEMDSWKITEAGKDELP